MMRTGWRKFDGPKLGELFPLGRLMMTPTASFLLDDVAIGNLMAMHAAGQWASPDDLLNVVEQQANEDTLKRLASGVMAGDIVSRYRVSNRCGKDAEVTVLTSSAGGRISTTICLPRER